MHRRGDVAPVRMPECYSQDIKVEKNRARQLLEPPYRGRLIEDGGELVLQAINGKQYRVVAANRELPLDQRVLTLSAKALRRIGDSENPLAEAKWAGPRMPLSPDEVRESWKNTFQFTLADIAENRPGLRSPQLGALHSVLGYWTTGTMQPATVVLPTGTGKTETMVALAVAALVPRLLVVVPSDVLRTQIAGKFESLGVLQSGGVIGANALCPVVGQLKHRFDDSDNAVAFAEMINVLVTTPAALFASAPETTQFLLDMFSHLFIDEAHHVEASTWRNIRDSFDGRPIVQFTATPFREDGRRLSGRIVYSLPLREAQAQGYFSRINYVSVPELYAPDEAIAERAIARLRKDIEEGFDHVLMARVRRIGRAREVKEIYSRLAPDLHPVVLNSSLPAKDRRTALRSLRGRESRIIVCVDMLGEGFDLPSLKVAAIHDPHKSLGVTLQFVGRFARVAGPMIGEASVFTPRPDMRHDDHLRRLYAEEPDWNVIIRDLSEAAVGEEVEIGDFEAAFAALPGEVSLRNIEPKMSTVAYRTQCGSWNPYAIYDMYSEGGLFTDPIAVNESDKVCWYVTELRTPVRWGEIETVAETTYDLYVIYWDERRQLLYINSSNNDSQHEHVAQKVGGASAELIKGETVYRAMADIQRLVPTNVGLLDVRNRSRRFSMHVGADVTEGFPVAEAQTKTKTNIFAYGFERGARVSIGASLKGRIWSYRVAPTLKHWTDWCDLIGQKLIDEGVSIDDIMRNFIRPELARQRPPLVALALEWPWELLLTGNQELLLVHNEVSFPLLDVDLRVTAFDTEGPIRFELRCPHWVSRYDLWFEVDGIVCQPSGDEVYVATTRGQTSLSAFLVKNPLTVIFEKDAIVVPPGILLKPDRTLPPYDREKISALDWTNIDLRKESQGADRAQDSIQARMIAWLLESERWDLIIDDDGTGEVADIVAVREDEGQLIVRLVHCKYAIGGTVGARVEDLYELCGQAQRSVRWRRNIDAFFRHVIDRERRRVARLNRTGLIVGDAGRLYELHDRARLLQPHFQVAVVQPGLSKSRATESQLDLLSSTETYIYETAYAPLMVFSSV